MRSLRGMAAVAPAGLAAARGARRCSGSAGRAAARRRGGRRTAVARPGRRARRRRRRGRGRRRGLGAAGGWGARRGGARRVAAGGVGGLGGRLRRRRCSARRDARRRHAAAPAGDDGGGEAEGGRRSRPRAQADAGQGGRRRPRRTAATPVAAAARDDAPRPRRPPRRQPGRRPAPATAEADGRRASPSSASSAERRKFAGGKITGFVRQGGVWLSTPSGAPDDQHPTAPCRAASGRSLREIAESRTAVIEDWRSRTSASCRRLPPRRSRSRRPPSRTSRGVPSATTARASLVARRLTAEARRLDPRAGALAEDWLRSSSRSSPWPRRGAAAGDRRRTRVGGGDPAAHGTAARETPTRGTPSSSSSRGSAWRRPPSCSWPATGWRSTSGRPACRSQWGRGRRDGLGDGAPADEGEAGRPVTHGGLRLEERVTGLPRRPCGTVAAVSARSRRNHRAPLRHPPRLRPADSETHRHATWMELFFDLVFVAAVARLAEMLIERRRRDGLAAVRRACSSRSPGRGWATRTTPTASTPTTCRTARWSPPAWLAVAAMAVAIGDFSDEGLDALRDRLRRASASCCCIMYVRARHHVPEMRDAINVYLVGFGAGRAAAGSRRVRHRRPRGSALVCRAAVEFGTPIVGWKVIATAPIDRHHLEERFGLFTIIVLGEAVIAVVVGTDVKRLGGARGARRDVRLRGRVVALWWTYFDLNGAVAAAARLLGVRLRLRARAALDRAHRVRRGDEARDQARRGVALRPRVALGARRRRRAVLHRRLRSTSRRCAASRRYQPRCAWSSSPACSSLAAARRAPARRRRCRVVVLIAILLGPCSRRSACARPSAARSGGWSARRSGRAACPAGAARLSVSVVGGVARRP